jgi:hypothetical protein
MALLDFDARQIFWSGTMSLAIGATNARPFRPVEESLMIMMFRHGSAQRFSGQGLFIQYIQERFEYSTCTNAT